MTNSTVKGAIPYLLLRAPGWSLDGGATADEFPEGLHFGGVWTTSYESWPEPNRSVGAAVMMARPERTLRHLASELGTIEDVTIKGAPAVAVEEHSVQDGHLIATHVFWSMGSYVAWFTVYETHQDDAVAIAGRLETVKEAEWRAAVDRAD